MKRNEGDVPEEYSNCLDSVLHIPHKILKYHDVDHLPQLVLHHLGHEKCFDFTKAAYFVDNPDFDHFVGVAGFSKDELSRYHDNLWDDPHIAGASIKKIAFSDQVGNILRASFKKKHIDFHNDKEVKSLGKELGMSNPQFVSWDMKHGNHGLLIFEGRELSDKIRKVLEQAVAFLGFCPI